MIASHTQSNVNPAFVAQTRAPQVSVIIPAYNVADYIAETLDSVFAQTFVDFEAIVVNDGSPDTERFERAMQPYIDNIVYLKQENGGAGAARNAGLRAARGEFVAFLDGDDVWLPNYLEQQMKFIRACGCDLACADAAFTGDAATQPTFMTAWMNDASPTGDVSFLELVDAKRSLVTSGVVAKRQPILEIGCFDESLRRGQDFDLWLRLSLSGARLSYQREVLLKYRRRDDGLSGDVINSHQRELKIFDKIEQSYNLAPEQRTKTETVIRNRRALLQFEMGKLYAARGDVSESRNAFTNAHHLRPSLKARAALSLTRFAPALMRAICARRT